MGCLGGIGAERLTGGDQGDRALEQGKAGAFGRGYTPCVSVKQGEGEGEGELPCGKYYQSFS